MRVDGTWSIGGISISGSLRVALCLLLTSGCSSSDDSKTADAGSDIADGEANVTDAGRTNQKDAGEAGQCLDFLSDCQRGSDCCSGRCYGGSSNGQHLDPDASMDGPGICQGS